MCFAYANISKEQFMALSAAMTTSRGEIRLDLREDKAPVTVASFVNLAKRGSSTMASFFTV